MITRKIYPETILATAVRFGPVNDHGIEVCTFQYTASDGVQYIATAKVDRNSRKRRLWCPRCGQRAKWLNTTPRGLACDCCQERQGQS